MTKTAQHQHVPRPTDAEARWLRSVQSDHVDFYFPWSTGNMPAFYREGIKVRSRAKDRGVLGRMQGKGWIENFKPKGWQRSDPHSVRLTELGVKVLVKAGPDRV